MSEEGRSLRNQIVMALTEDNRLHITEVRQLWNLVKGELEPAKLFNVAIGALAINVPKTLGDLSTAGVSSLLRELSNNGR
jgi:hypothetical protein